MTCTTARHQDEDVLAFVLGSSQVVPLYIQSMLFTR